MSRIPPLELGRYPPASVLHTQLQMHHQMLYRQHNMTHHHHHHQHHPAEELTNNGWLLPPTPGAGPTLPGNVTVSLQNAKLWQQFHAETTEMIITKLGRRMFPSLQLQIEGLERRGRYCLLLEVTPASRRRHKYLGGGGENGGSGSSSGRGWTTAGPAEPQPHVNRRVYLHPDSPATGSHWMQHPVSFNKLKLTNNAVDHHSNVVLTSMHKYIPTVWIVRCDDVSRLALLFTQPASSFCFPETEFIAVTAYQNENITKLKIDNNPFAKGFRETGQSRCKRKMASFDSSEIEDAGVRDGDRLRVEDEDEGNVSSSESLSNPLPPQVFDDAQQFSQRAKRVVSESGSFDDSGVSSSSSSSLADSASPQFHLASEKNRKSSSTPAPLQPPLHRPWMDHHEEENKENAGSDGVATPDLQGHLITQDRHTTVGNNQARQQHHHHHHHQQQQQQQQHPAFVQPQVVQNNYTRDVFSPHHHHHHHRHHHQNQHFSPAVEFARINQQIQNHYQQMHYEQLYCSQISQIQRLKNIAMQFNSPPFTPALTPRCLDISPPNPILDLPYSVRINKVASQFDRQSCPPITPPSPSLSPAVSVDGSSESS